MQHSPEPEAFAAEGLGKRFGDREVISGLSFAAGSGRALGLLGPNGSGKTTTVRLLTGVLSPSAGHVRLFGEALTPESAPALRSRIGVQTDTNLYESLSVRQNLRTWGELYGVPAKRLPARIDEVLHMLDLTGRIDSLVGELSKGMRQKLSVGRAILHEPELLFLDEPTAGLDPEASEELIGYLRGLIRAGNTTVVIATHQLHGLETLCDDLTIIAGGRLLRSGTVPGLLTERWPRPRYRLRLLGDETAIERVLAAHVAPDTRPAPGADGWAVELPADDAAPRLVAELVGAGIGVASVEPDVPSIQDLYFATVADARGDTPAVGNGGATERTPE